MERQLLLAMAITTEWKVNNLERHTADGIVYTVHYTVGSSDGTYQAGAYGSVGLEAPEEGTEVIPFAELTEEIVVGWVKDVLTAEKVADVEAALEEQINEQHAPTKASGLPW